MQFRYREFLLLWIILITKGKDIRVNIVNLNKKNNLNKDKFLITWNSIVYPLSKSCWDLNHRFRPSVRPNFDAIIAAPIIWINFKFRLWLYIDDVFVVSNFDWCPILTSNFLRLPIFQYMIWWRKISWLSMVSNLVSCFI